jgi:hypothetical protein
MVTPLSRWTDGRSGAGRPIHYRDGEARGSRLAIALSLWRHLGSGMPPQCRHSCYVGVNVGVRHPGMSSGSGTGIGTCGTHSPR